MCFCSCVTGYALDSFIYLSHPNVVDNILKFTIFCHHTGQCKVLSIPSFLHILLEKRDIDAVVY